jgi:hypothetical protein
MARLGGISSNLVQAKNKRRAVINVIKVAFMMDEGNNELIKDLVILTGIPKVKLLNQAIDEFIKKFIKDNHLEEEVKELQALKSRKKK